MSVSLNYRPGSLGSLCRLGNLLDRGSGPGSGTADPRGPVQVGVGFHQHGGSSVQHCDSPRGPAGGPPGIYDRFIVLGVLG